METMAFRLLCLAFWSYAFGMLFGVVCSGNDRAGRVLSFGASALAGLAGAVGAVMLLMEHSVPRSLGFMAAVLPGAAVAIRFDGLGVFFTLIVSAVGLAISIYSLGYARGYAGHKSAGLLGALFNLLLLSTAFVFLANNAFFFLIAWELMALCAYCLISFEHEEVETRDAGVLYFIMSHIGTGCLILGFLLLFQASHSLSFESFRGLGNTMPEGTRNAAFVLFLIGFGVKAGIVPLHIWLPAAHPVAPSNVSALLSSVIIKTGIYGMVRVYFDFLGTPPNWWGVTVLAIGTASAVLGVLFALMEHDLKRLLAYHSIENIGIILMGVGAAMMFTHSGNTALAAMALAAGLYHTINHAMFKSLLFLGAGAVLQSTRTRNMEELGGLIKRMRWTSLFFLIGAAAISALPPLNGFVSEWLTYQSLLQGYGTTPSLVRVMFPLGGALLALTGALAAACFVKAFAITFLAQPRSQAAQDARECGPEMLFGQALLTGACVVLGLCPLVLLQLLDPATSQLTGDIVSQRLVSPDGLVLSGVMSQGGTISTSGIALALLCLLPAPLALAAFFGPLAKTRIGPTWDCGLRGLTPKMEYTATGFSKPLRMIFKALFRPKREVQREYDFSPYFATNVRFESHVEEVFQTRIYRPLNRRVLRFSRRMRALQAGSIQAYLIYIFVTLVFLLMFAL